jgi:hypothetical protein
MLNFFAADPDPGPFDPRSGMKNLKFGTRNTASDKEKDLL